MGSRRSLLARGAGRRFGGRRPRSSLFPVGGIGIKSKYLLLGYGRANRAVAAYLSKLRREYVIYDDNIASYNDEPDLAKITLAVKSGGFPSDHPVMLKCIDAGVGIASDLELFYRFFPGRKTITVTGTNGKTTTAALIAHLLPGVDLGGNNGAPLFEFADSSRRSSSKRQVLCWNIAMILGQTSRYCLNHAAPSFQASRFLGICVGEEENRRRPLAGRRLNL